MLQYFHSCILKSWRYIIYTSLNENDWMNFLSWDNFLPKRHLNRKWNWWDAPWWKVSVSQFLQICFFRLRATNALSTFDAVEGVKNSVFFPPPWPNVLRKLHLSPGCIIPATTYVILMHQAAKQFAYIDLAMIPPADFSPFRTWQLEWGETGPKVFKDLKFKNRTRSIYLKDGQTHSHLFTPGFLLAKSPGWASYKKFYFPHVRVAWLIAFLPSSSSRHSSPPLSFPPCDGQK